jgi:hypothetical protein
MADVGPYDPPARPVLYMPSPAYWGPDHSEPCPCGSTKRAGDCHVNRARGNWKLPPYAPLLVDSKTGIACDGCYAWVTSDCSPELASEHWLPNGIGLTIGAAGQVLVSGLRHQLGRQQAVQNETFAAPILCQRHSDALSRLDAAAAAVFQTLDHYQTDLCTQPDRHGSEFDLFSGEVLERWLLKLLWGGVAANAFTRSGQPVGSLRASASQTMLAEYLFRTGQLPSGWGFNVVAHQVGVNATADADVEVGKSWKSNRQADGLYVSAEMTTSRTGRITPVTAGRALRQAVLPGLAEYRSLATDPSMSGATITIDISDPPAGTDDSAAPSVALTSQRLRVFDGE